MKKPKKPKALEMSEPVYNEDLSEVPAEEEISLMGQANLLQLESLIENALEYAGALSKTTRLRELSLTVTKLEEANLWLGQAKKRRG